MLSKHLTDPLMLWSCEICLQEQKLKEANASQQQKASPVAAASSNPFADSSPVSSSQATNLFGSPTEPSMSALSANSKPSDDLLSLTGNPFMDSVQNVMASAYPTTSSNPFGSPVFQTNGETVPCVWTLFLCLFGLLSAEDFTRALSVVVFWAFVCWRLFMNTFCCSILKSSSIFSSLLSLLGHVFTCIPTVWKD